MPFWSELPVFFSAFQVLQFKMQGFLTKGDLHSILKDMSNHVN